MYACEVCIFLSSVFLKSIKNFREGKLTLVVCDSFAWIDDKCSGKEAAGQMGLLKEDHRVHAYIGPPCSTGTFLLITVV